MNKSQMSAEQSANRDSLARTLESKGWKLRNTEAYDADFFLDAELSARKRNNQCIIEVNVSYENSYVGVIFASFKSGRAEYITYYKNLDDIDQIIGRILDVSGTVSVMSSISLAKDLISKFTESVYFFNGEELTLINEKNIQDIFDSNQ